MKQGNKLQGAAIGFVWFIIATDILNTIFFTSMLIICSAYECP
jgi:hypothetical protein